MTVIVVGAGLSGLVCARILLERGVDVLVVEASDGVGGRVRSDKIGGFILDRGFQVLLDAYPAARRNLDLSALTLSPFPPGAMICRGGVRTILSDPRRAYNMHDVFETALTGLVPLADKVRLLTLANLLSDLAGDDAASADVSIEDYLRSEGFANSTIDGFFRPFYGGILLDRSLSASAGLFRFYYAMQNRGHACLPANGMGEIPRQVAEPLIASQAVRLNAVVTSLVQKDGRTAGVVIDHGEELPANSVVLALDAPALANLTECDIPTKGVSVTTLYFAGSKPVWRTPYLMLNANNNGLVNNAQMLTNVCPTYAPVGKTLLGISILGLPEMDNHELASAALAEMRELFAGDRAALIALAGCRLLDVSRIAYAQPLQSPGRTPQMPAVSRGLFYAGDWTASGSINGALLSGERAAAAVLESGNV